MKIDSQTLMSLIEKWESYPIDRVRNINAEPEELINYAVQGGEYNGLKKAAKDLRTLIDLFSHK